MPNPAGLEFIENSLRLYTNRWYKWEPLFFTGKGGRKSNIFYQRGFIVHEVSYHSRGNGDPAQGIGGEQTPDPGRRRSSH